jgi:CHAD domain-containing protein
VFQGYRDLLKDLYKDVEESRGITVEDYHRVRSKMLEVRAVLESVRETYMRSKENLFECVKGYEPRLDLNAMDYKTTGGQRAHAFQEDFDMDC